MLIGVQAACPSTARKPDLSRRRHGAAPDHKELVELKKKIAAPIAAPEEVGQVRSLMKGVFELETGRDNFTGRVRP